MSRALQLLYCLFELYHILVGSLIITLSMLQLSLKPLDLFLGDLKVSHQTLHVLLGVAFVVHLFESVALPELYFL